VLVIVLPVYFEVIGGFPLGRFGTLRLRRRSLFTSPEPRAGNGKSRVRCFNWHGSFGPAARNEIDRANFPQNQGGNYCESPQSLLFFHSLNKNKNELGRIRPEYDTTFIFFSDCGPELFVRKLQVIETSA